MINKRLHVLSVWRGGCFLPVGDVCGYSYPLLIPMWRSWHVGVTKARLNTCLVRDAWKFGDTLSIGLLSENPCNRGDRGASEYAAGMPPGVPRSILLSPASARASSGRSVVVSTPPVCAWGPHGEEPLFLLLSSSISRDPLHILRFCAVGSHCFLIVCKNSCPLDGWRPIIHWLELFRLSLRTTAI